MPLDDLSRSRSLLRFGLALALSTLLAPSMPSRAEVEEAIPQTRNSPLVAVPERAKIEGFTGGASYSYEFKVPPGTGGATPELRLTYSSLTKNTAYGFGWNLNLDSIERCTRFGAPQYDAPESAASVDQFELGGELIVRDPSNASTFYRRDHDGSRIRYFATSDSWEVALPDGTRRLYGSRSSAAKSILTNGPNQSGAVFRWALDEVVDPSGNSYRIDYTTVNDSSHQRTDWVENIYPERFQYSFHPDSSTPSTQSQRTVEFEWEDRGYSGEEQDKSSSFRSGFRIETEKRLQSVTVGLDTDTNVGIDEVTRRYDLIYSPKFSAAYPDESPFSKLIEIRRFGSGANSFSSTFEYTPRPTASSGYAISPDPSQAHIWLDSPNGGTFRYRGHADVDLLDMNGDGVVDRVNAKGGTWHVSYGSIDANGRLQFAPKVKWQWCTDATGTNCQDAPPAWVYHPELIRAIDPVWSPPGAYVPPRQVLDLVDMDGDGLPDRIESMSGEGGSPHHWHWERNLGDRWAKKELWSGITLPGGTDSSQSHIGYSKPLPGTSDTTVEYTELADVTGDGRPDHLVRDLSGSVWVSVNLGCSPTCGFGTATKSLNSLGPSANQYLGMEVSIGGLVRETESDIVDINGDGLPDSVRISQVTGEMAVGFGVGNPSNSQVWFQEWDSAIGRHVGGEIHAAGTSTGELSRRYDGSGLTSDARTRGTIADFNGDGTPDQVSQYYAADVVDPDVIQAWFRPGLGDGRFSTHAVQVPFSAGTLVFGAARNLQVADLDGDGLAEKTRVRCLDATCSTYDWHITALTAPEGLLARVVNELGGSTEFTYESSRVVEATSAGPTISESPPSAAGLARQARWVPTLVEHRDGRTGTAVEQLTNEFSELRYDTATRRDFGFRFAGVTDALGTATRTHYHQVEPKLGKAQSVDTVVGGSIVQSTSTLWSGWQTENEFSTQANPVTVPGSWLTVPLIVTSTQYEDASDPTATTVTKSVHRDYDRNTASILREHDLGDDIGDGSDDLLKVYSYNPNRSSTHWVVSLSATEDEWHGVDSSGGGVTWAGGRTRFYDGATSATDPPTGGTLTKLETSFDADGLGPLTAIWTNTESWSYDVFGNPTHFYDARAADFGGSAARTLTYDAKTNTSPTLTTNRLGHETRFALDGGLGEVTRMLDPNGFLRCWEYDGLGRLTTVRQKSSALVAQTEAALEAGTCDVVTAAFTFHDVGQPNLQRIDETRKTGTASGDLVTRRYFDGWGREYERHEPGTGSDFIVAAKSWGPRGEEDCVTLPIRAGGKLAGNCRDNAPFRTTSFDPLFRPLETRLWSTASANVLEEDSTYSFVSDPALAGGQIVQERIRYSGHPTIPDRKRKFFLDSNGDALAIDEYDGSAWSRTVLERDPRGRIVAVDGPDIVYDFGPIADPNVLGVTYDFNDRRVRVVPPGSYKNVLVPGVGTIPTCAPDPAAQPAWMFIYDANGNLAARFSPKGTQVSFVYDELDRLSRRDLAPFSQTAGYEDTQFVYDDPAGLAIGRLSYAFNSDVLTLRSYHLDGEVATEARVMGGSAFTTAYEYDLQGRRTTETFPDGSIATNHYAGGELTKISVDDGGGAIDVVDSIAFHASGAMSNLRFEPSGVVGSYTFDPNTHTPESATTSTPSSVIQAISYSFDRAGNLASRSDTKGLTEIFDYDSLHRLIEADSSSSSDPHKYGKLAYDYSLAGNLESIDRNGVVQTLRYGCSQGGPQAVTHLEENGVYLRSYQYNRDGEAKEISQVGSAPTILERDDLGQIDFVTVGANTSDYGYDHEQKRAFKSQTIGGGAKADRLYVSPGYEVNLTDSSHERHFYVRGKRVATVNRSGIGTLADPGVPSSETWRFYHPDQVMTNGLVTDESGNVVQRTIHDPFGLQLAMLDGQGAGIQHTRTTTRHLFTGQEFDPESGLSYYGARYYDPAVGRFLSRDPVLPVDRPEEPQRTNLYAYALNRPTTVIDPDGRDGILGFVKKAAEKIVEEVESLSDDVTSGMTDETTFGNDEIGGSFGGPGEPPSVEESNEEAESVIEAFETGRRISEAFGISGGDSGAKETSKEDSAGKEATGGRGDGRLPGSGPPRTPEQTQEQERSIEHSQSHYRKNDMPERIRSTSRSNQRARHDRSRTRTQEQGQRDFGYQDGYDDQDD